MDEDHDELTAALRSLLGERGKLCVATNSLKFMFGSRDGGEERVYLWIDPPWRMTLEGRLVTGSVDCPARRDFEEEDEVVYESQFSLWADLLDPLNAGVLVEATVHPTFPDLRLVFRSGYTIETFGNSVEGCWWYYRERATGVVFEAGAAGVVRDWTEPIPPGR